MESRLSRNLERYRALLAEAEASVDYWKEVAAHQFIRELESRMERQEVSRAELARRLGTSKAYITKVLGANVNFTLATMTRLAMALEAEVSVRLTDRNAGKRLRARPGSRRKEPPSDLSGASSTTTTKRSGTARATRSPRTPKF